MVRARKNIKRSSGRKKVSRRKVVNPFADGFTHEPVGKAWDRKKTVRENYAELHLDGDPNAHTSIVASAAAASAPEPLFVGEFSRVGLYFDALFILLASDLEAIKDKLHTPGRKSVNHVGSEEVRPPMQQHTHPVQPHVILLCADGVFGPPRQQIWPRIPSHGQGHPAQLQPVHRHPPAEAPGPPEAVPRRAAAAGCRAGRRRSPGG